MYFFILGAYVVGVPDDRFGEELCAWIKINKIKGMQRKPCSGRSNSASKSPPSIQIIEDEIKNVRALLSKTSAELRRLKNNGRMTRRTKRNRAEISKNCGSISNYTLICYMEKLKKRLKYLSKKRKRTMQKLVAKQLNEQFEKDQKSVFDKFKAFIEKDEENLTPVFVETPTERRHFDDVKVVEKFWRELWEKSDTGNPDASWLKDIEAKFAEIVPNVFDGDLIVDDSISRKMMAKKKNWSSPGPDKITNFW